MLGLPVSELVLHVRRPRGDTHGEVGEQRRDEIGARVGGFGDQAEAVRRETDGQLQDDKDGGSREVATTDPKGTVFRLVEYGPGVAPRNHRTESIDYAIVMSGEIDMDLDGTRVHLKAGDVLVQRGTIHNWNNRGTEPCVVAFVLVAAKPVERGAKLLTATN
jgi:quercetin dioxygenase-like cupin family protein